MFNIYAKSDVKLGDEQELAINTNTSGTVSFSVNPSGLAVNSGNPYAVQGNINKYVPTFSNQRQALIDGVMDRCPATASVGATANCTVGRVAVNDRKQCTFAFRMKYISGTGSSWCPIFGVSNNWYIYHNNTGQRILHFTFQNAAKTGSYIFTLYKTLNIGSYHNIVVIYDFDMVVRTGTVTCYLDSTSNPGITALTTLHEVGSYSTDTDAVWSLDFCRNYPCKANIYDFMMHNTTAWDIATIGKFMNAETIDSANYSAYWPMKKDNDLPYLVDYDKKNNVPMYIPGTYPNLEWVPEGVTPSPFATKHIVPMIASATGTYTITATKIDQNGVVTTTTTDVTVLPALSTEQSTAQLMIYASIAGTATIAMDNPIIGFPATAAVVAGKNQISGTVTGSGTCNVTVTLDGASNTTQFIVENITTMAKAGPSQQYQVYL